MSKREIKFRVWNGTAKRYESQSHIKGHPLFSLDKRFELNCHQEPFDGEAVIQYEYEQFTGLHDKNGKEIYEGDIVQYSGYSDITYSLPGEVSIGPYFTHAQEFHHFGVRVKRIDMKETYFGLYDGVEDYVVVGNIHENPDLLK